MNKYVKYAQIDDINLFMKLRKKSYRDVININTNPRQWCHFAEAIKR